MRKITKLAINAFMKGENFSLGNTIVRVERDDKTCLFLHGNLIAVRLEQGRQITINTAGWQSNTTKERLNGLPNVSIVQRNYEWFLNGEKWDGKHKTINY